MKAGAFVLVSVALCFAESIGPVAAEPVIPTLPGVAPVPENDPFYTVPADVAAYPDGAVLASRPITAVAAQLPIAASAWQVLYKTSTVGGAPTATVATILVPIDPWRGPGARPLLSYQVAEDSVALHCAPSYTLRAGFGATLGAGQADAVVLGAALSNGWAVVVPDYQGPQSLWFDYPTTAHGVLDGVRAARDFAPAGIGLDAPIGLMGYSGGAYASMVAAEQQPGYAPDLTLSGVAIGGLPGDLNDALATVNGGAFAGFTVGGLVAFDRADPQAGISSMLNERGRQVLADGEDQCGADYLAKYAMLDVSSLTVIPDPLADPRLRSLMAANSPGQNTPTGPVYEFHSTSDEVTRLGPADAVLDSYCAAGIPVRRDRLPGEHLTGYLASLQPSLAYLADRFDGRPVPDDC
ncbi:lipase family protein [Nocardia sp. NPDC059240]|uniref:lipase family protein n=1 Tax=Nocardia sp. NPDC059240 TaxID=3346786 RepID=UPI00368BBD2B